MSARQKGFTLTEILITVTIIAILASLVVPRFLGTPDKAKRAEAFATIGAIRQGAAAYRAAWGGYPTGKQGYYEASADGTDGSMTGSECVNHGANFVWGEWADLGMKPPLSPNWAYFAGSECTSGTTTMQGVCVPPEAQKWVTYALKPACVDGGFRVEEGGSLQCWGPGC